MRREGIQDVNSSDSNWQTFSAALALTFSGMPAKAHLVISASGGRYARFFVASSELWCEIVHNDQLSEVVRMLDQSETQLREQGWDPPIEGRWENWHRVVGWPVHFDVYQKLADQVVAALRYGLRVGAPSELDIDSWIVDSDKEFPTKALADATRR
ncbi:TY-Chap domain-containing protein [Nocardia goodfellowii]